MLEKALKYLGWAVPIPSAEFAKDHWPLCAHLGTEHLSASALTTILEKIHTSNRPMAKREHHQECAWLAPESVLTKGSGLGYISVMTLSKADSVFRFSFLLGQGIRV